MYLELPIVVFLTHGSPQMSPVIENLKAIYQCHVFTSLTRFNATTFKKR